MTGWKRNRAQADACWRCNLQAQINPPKQMGKVLYLDRFRGQGKPRESGGKRV